MNSELSSAEVPHLAAVVVGEVLLGVLRGDSGQQEGPALLANAVMVVGPVGGCGLQHQEAREGLMLGLLVWRQNGNQTRSMPKMGPSSSKAASEDQQRLLPTCCMEHNRGSAENDVLTTECLADSCSASTTRTISSMFLPAAKARAMASAQARRHRSSKHEQAVTHPRLQGS